MSQFLKLLPDRIKESLSKHSFFTFIYAKTILRSEQVNKNLNGITIELTDRCNLRCSYCPKGYGIGVNGGDMDFNLFKKIVDEANRYFKIEQIPLVGFGEPLLYPYLIEAIEYIHKNYPQVETIITTNGTLLNKQMGRKLIDSGLSSINISVNAFSASKYKELNNSDKFDVVMKNTHDFLEMLNINNKRRNPITFIQILGTVNTCDEINKFIKYWTPYLKPNARLKIHPMCNWGGQVDIKSERNIKGRYPCDQLQCRLIITREGIAIPCCMVLSYENDDLVLGNVKDKTIKELYMKGKIVELRKKDLEGRITEIKPCSVCDAWQITPNAWFKYPFYGVSKRKWI